MARSFSAIMTPSAIREASIMTFIIVPLVGGFVGGFAGAVAGVVMCVWHLDTYPDDDERARRLRRIVERLRQPIRLGLRRS